MRILLIGGAGFIGRFVVGGLLARGHSVTVFHRGGSAAELPQSAARIHGDRNSLETHLPDFERAAPDVVIDFVLSSERQARQLMNTFRGLTGRIVAISSMDVYRACGISHRLEPGPLQPLPLTEDSGLRTRLSPYGPDTLAALRKVFPWLDDEYDKIPVERAVMANPQLPYTILRLPMVYGPGDPLHRFFPVIKRIDDGRSAILMQADAADWRGTRGYVENVAAAIALAAVSAQAAGRVYNVGEAAALSEFEWASRIGERMGWKGRILPLPEERIPAHLRVPSNTAQHWVASTDRVRRELGFEESVSLDAALDRTIAWERSNPPSPIDPRQFDYAAEDAALAAIS